MRLLICALISMSLGAAEFAANVILPQRHVMAVNQAEAVHLEAVDARVEIVDGVATTTLELRLRNPTSRMQEAELVIPVPGEVAVKAVELDGLSSSPQARLLPIAEARAIYQRIVAKMKDPALVEFAGDRLLHSSVFPVPPNGEQRLRISWEQVLSPQGGRIDYVLPRSSAIGGDVPWTIQVTCRDTRGIAGLHSPSHHLRRDESIGQLQRLSLDPIDAKAPGSFRISYQPSEVPAVGVALHPDGKGGGWFLLTVGAPDQSPDRPSIPRDVTIVLDRSGSMRGGKLDQAREAALQLIAGLSPADRFNVICYHHGVESFATASVAKTAANEAAVTAWLGAVQPRGGTNIQQSLLTALAQPVQDDALALVVFCTDGVPTVGETIESRIREIAKAGNSGHRRIFTIGVGSEIDTHLLEMLADDSRATASFVEPGADVEMVVGQVADRLEGPVMTDLIFSAAERGRLLDVQPNALGDLFVGQTVLIAGRYVGSAPIAVEIRGRSVAGEQALRAVIDPSLASVANAHVPRLWAVRTIAALVDQVRQLGAGTTPADLQADPRAKELIDEIVALSTEFGVLTEYTAFLADDGSDATAFRQRAADAMVEQVAERAGASALSQSMNSVARKGATTINLDNRRKDEDLRDVEVATVQPTSAASYYKRGDTWVEGKVLATQETAIDETIVFASAAYFTLADELSSEGRQVALAMNGSLLLDHHGRRIRVLAPE